MESFLVTTCPQQIPDILTYNTYRSSTVRIGNKPTGPQYEVFRNGNKLTSKKIVCSALYKLCVFYKSETTNIL